MEKVSFELERGEIVGIMGPSGCGKTTIAKIISALLDPSSGEILFQGRDILKMTRRETIAMRHDLQVIFQNPKMVLHPNYTVYKLLAEPIRLFSLAENKADEARRVREILAAVGLSEQLLNRRPNEISGGQSQRVSIARSLILKPKLLIADEATSMLDLSVQAQILHLFNDLHAKANPAILLISHDENVVNNFCHRVIVMDSGKIVNTYLTSKIKSAS